MDYKESTHPIKKTDDINRDSCFAAKRGETNGSRQEASAESIAALQPEQENDACAVFAHNLVKLRKKLGLSRKQLAEKLDINYNTLRNYEKGLREPGHEFLIKISIFFGVSTDLLLGIQTTEDMDVQTLLAAFASLNAQGREKLLSYADDLLLTGKYFIPSTPG